jgi:Cu-Zn family superoxide dismutase
MRRTYLAAATGLLPALPLSAQDMTDADVRNRDGTSMGRVRSTPRPSATTRVTFELESVPERTHAIHQPETGDNSADYFTSAGGHIAGEMHHGTRVDGGPRPGDLLDVTVPEDGV